MKLENHFSIAGRLAEDAKVLNIHNGKRADIKLHLFMDEEGNVSNIWKKIIAISKDANAFHNLKKDSLMRFDGYFDVNGYYDRRTKKHRQEVIYRATSWKPES